jgi:putative ABC transport system ATP-binding protein
MNASVCRLVSASKVFDDGSERVIAVKGADLSVSSRESVAIVGPSGSGKTTLLTLMGILQEPTTGDVFFQEQDVRRLTTSERRRLRLTKVGFVFQQLRLIPTLSVAENIELPMVFASLPLDQRIKRAKAMITSVGLDGKESRRPNQLSVGEQQRVAVARALINEPALILADEPTSQLDSSNGMKIVELILTLRERIDCGVAITTHDSKVCDRADRVYAMEDGVLRQR